MEEVLNNILKQGRSLLFSFIEMMPVYLFFMHTYAFILSMGVIYYGFNEESIKYQLDIIDQFIEISLASLILMILLSAKWGVLAKVSYICLVLWWVLNTVYYIFDMSQDLYFNIFSAVIFITFVILLIRSKTNR